jgi:predicted CXXCH cytochrome family protein
MAKRANHSRQWRSAAITGCALVALLFWPGCSEKRDYKLLSFFFDGVPDPNAPRAGMPGAGGRGAAGTVVMASTHKPFAEEKCPVCHTNKQGLGFQSTTLGAEVCLTCHKTLLKAHPYMHGPVTAMACLWCHDPHETAFPHLLKAASPDICLQCHDRELLSANPPEHVAGGSCLNCHSGHGSSVRYLLKPQTTTAPSTAPTGTKDRT